MTSQPSFEYLSGNIEVELMDRSELWKFIFIFFGNFRSNIPSACTAAARGMFFKGKSGHVTALLRSRAVTPLTQAKAHTMPAKALIIYPSCSPLSAPTLLRSPHSIHTRLAVSGALEELPQFSTGCSLCQNSLPRTSTQLASSAF